MEVKCPACGAVVPLSDVLLSERTDHEVWLVVMCPKCYAEIDRTPKAKLREQQTDVTPDR